MEAIDHAKSIMIKQRINVMHISRTHQGYRAVKPEQKHFGTVVGIVYRDISTT
jgi:hypothetical protein